MVGGTEGKTILAINNKKKPLDDLRVRQAIAYAIDRKAIIDGALERPRHADRQPSDAERPRLRRSDRPVSARSRQGEGAAQGSRREDRRSNLTLTLPPPAYARKGGEIIAAELAEVGIQAKIENVEWAQWLSNVYTNKNFDLTIISHVEPLDIDIYANPNYYFGYDNKEFQAIIARWNAAPDLAAYKQALVDAQHKLADDCVNVFLFQLAERRRRRREAEGRLEGRADLRQRSLGAVLAVRGTR